MSSTSFEIFFERLSKISAANSAACLSRRATVRGTALWVTNGEWSKSAEPLTIARRERRAVEFAAEILDKRAKKISKKVEDIEALDARQRHKLRIAVKKLRYACEFFAGLFESRKQTNERKRFAGILKRLQGSLGALNDIEVHSVSP